ncbi:BCP1 family [Schizophyllum fasciatum]
MAKRKQGADEDDTGSDSDVPSLIDVSFDFCAPNAALDRPALQQLLAQLFQRDVDAGALADLALAQPRVGSTVKTEGEGGAPCAVLTVLGDRPAVRALVDYLVERAGAAFPTSTPALPTPTPTINSSTPTLHSSTSTSTPTSTPALHPPTPAPPTAGPTLHTALLALLADPGARLGIVLCERLVNMPVQVIPHMYRMLVGELREAVDAGEPFAFTHLLIPSRTYHLSEEEEERAASQSQPSHTNTNPSHTNPAHTTTNPFHTKPTKAKRANPAHAKPTRAKRAKTPAAQAHVARARPADGVYAFHPEDGVIAEFATHVADYPFARAEPRDRESFGLDTRGRLMLVPAERFVDMVRKMGETYC